MPNFFQRLQHGWNAFRGRDRPDYQDYGVGYANRPDRKHIRTGNDRSIITAIYNRIAMDVADNKIEHVKVDENGVYLETVKDSLNDCLTVEANLDQTSRALHLEQENALSVPQFQNCQNPTCLISLS